MPTPANRVSATAPEAVREDPLAHLPRTAILSYKKRRFIYGQDRPSTGIYLVLEGRVKVCRVAEGQEVVVEIYKPGDYFGESSLLGLPHYTEQAIALENTALMLWSADDIESIVADQPKLGVALCQILVDRTMVLGERIESLCVETVAQRLARSLITWSDRMGASREDGSLRMGALTHELLAQYVGTSREIITHHMNQFRKQGYINYSHREILVYRDAFADWLQKSATGEASGNG